MDMFEPEIHISDSMILLAFMNPGYLNSSFYNKRETAIIEEDTGLTSPNMFELLGDSIYELLLLNYAYRYGLGLTTGSYDAGKSNKSMACIMRNSPIYQYVRVLHSNDGDKGVADAFECILGVVFWSLLENRFMLQSLTEEFYNWMDTTFGIEEIFNDLIMGYDPCGEEVEGKKMDIYHKLIISSQKFLIILDGVIRNYYDPHAASIIHNEYSSIAHHIIPFLLGGISRSLEYQDVLGQLVSIPASSLPGTH